MQTQNKGKITIDEMASSMGKIIPSASSLGVNLEQLGAGYAELTSKGIKGAEATTYMNSMLNELSKSSTGVATILKEKTGKSFSECMKEGMSLGDVMSILQESAKESGKEFGELWSSAEAGKAGLVLATNAGEDFNKLLVDMKNSAGTTEEAFNKMSETSEFKMQKSLNELKNSAIKLGQSMLPVLDSVSEGISKLAEWIGNLDGETVKSIAQFGAYAIAIGGAMKVTGSLITVLGKGCNGLSGMFKILDKVTGGSSKLSKAIAGLNGAKGLGGTVSALKGVGLAAAPLLVTFAALGTAIYAVHSYNKLMSESCTTAWEDLSFGEKVMAKLSGQTVKTRDELEELGLVTQEFGEGFSDDFKEAFESANDDISDFRFALNEITFDGVITQEEADALSGRINEALEQAKSTIASKKEETQKTLMEIFNTNGNISEIEQQVIDSWNSYYDKSSEEVTRVEGEINELKKQLQEAGSKEEMEQIEKQINEKYARIKELELQALSDSTEEQIYMQKECRNKIATMDAESAEKYLSEKKSQIDEEVLQIKTGYDTQIEMAQEHIGIYKDMSDQQIQVTIEGLEKEKEEAIKGKQEVWSSMIQAAEEGNENLIGVINESNGKILENDQISAQERIQKYMETYEGLKNITESGVYDIEGSNNKLVVSYDETSGKITGIAEITANDTRSRMTEIMATNDLAKDNVRDLGDNWVVDFNKMNNATVDSSNQIRSAGGDIMGSLEGVKTKADGAKEGLLQMSGRTYRIEVDKYGAVTGIQEVQDKSDTLKNTGDATVKIDADTSGFDISFSSIWDKVASLSSIVTGISFPHFETGGETNASGLYITNEKGVELIDTVAGNEPMAVGYTADGMLTRMSSNTKITNATMTTAKMEAMIQDEVSRTTNDKISKMLDSKFNQLAAKLTNNNKEVVVNNDFNPVITELQKGFEQLGYDLSNIDFNKSEVKLVLTNGKELARAIATDVEKENNRKNKNRNI